MRQTWPQGREQQRAGWDGGHPRGWAVGWGCSGCPDGGRDSKIPDCDGWGMQFDLIQRALRVFLAILFAILRRDNDEN